MRIKATQKAQAATTATHDFLHDQLVGLNMAEEVISRMIPASVLGAFSAPTLWHSDLHLGNIYVSDDDPTQIVSLIDWQGVVISPIFCQVRFPPFLSVDQGYQMGNQAPRLPGNLDEMAEEERQLALFQHKQYSMAKIYEGNLALNHQNAYRALQLPSFFRELMIRCGEVSMEGVTPLRECLIHISEVWEEAGFLGHCPISFSGQELKKHASEFEEYETYHRIREGAQEFLGTDSEGWFSPMENFEEKKQLNRKLRQQLIDDCAEYGKTQDEIRAIWPF
nr:hypothetical protein CFP56_44471 [Quercus suber]